MWLAELHFWHYHIFSLKRITRIFYHSFSEYRTDTVLEYWQELKNLLDSYQGIDAETNEKSKERNPRSFEARPQSNRKDQSPAVVAEQNKQISIAQPHKDGETKIAVIAKLAKIAYELQRSTSTSIYSHN